MSVCRLRNLGSSPLRLGATRTERREEPLDKPCFVMLLLGRSAGDRDKYYGPFDNETDAQNWILNQPSDVRKNLIIVQLRSPNKVRKSVSFWLPTRCEKGEEYDN